MKKIGIIGGLSEESSQYYQKEILQKIRQIYGPDNSPWWSIEAINLNTILALMEKNQWDTIESLLKIMLQNLIYTGCERIIICSNTMHRFAEKLEESIALYKSEKEIQFIDIRGAVAEQLQKDGIKIIGILGSMYTKKWKLYEKILNPYGIKVIHPSNKDVEYINTTIFKKFTHGIFEKSDYARFKKIISNGICDGWVMGCTEIPLLFQKYSNPNQKLYDSIEIHCNALIHSIKV